MMIEQILEIRYQCQHPSCQIKKCKEGVLTVEESFLNQLSASLGDKTLFKSPRGLCRLGFPQTLRIMDSMRSMSAVADPSGDEGVSTASERIGHDPIEILKEEHKGVLKKLDLIEEQIRNRDVEGLWLTTAAVANDVALHSIKKEEGILFPLLKNSFALRGAIAVMKEDHRELMAFLHSFRDGLREGDILDGVAHSAIANLRSHIRKEDSEFFEMVNDYLDEEGKVLLSDGMMMAEESHSIIEAGDRCHGIDHDDEADSMERERFNETLLAIKQSATKDECCH